MTTEADRISRRLEMVEAVLLSLAVLGTAWSAYQSSQWGGIETFRLADVNAKSQQAMAQKILAHEQRILDAIIFMNFGNAVVEGKDKLAEYYLKGARPELRSSLKAWLDSKPLENPEGPAHIAVMPEYTKHVQAKFDEEYRSIRADVDRNMAEANHANQVSDRYLLLTVLFATVLCFVGMASKFDVPRVRITLLALASLILVVTLILLATYPVA
jgi:hypothetical protein